MRLAWVALVLFSCTTVALAAPPCSDAELATVAETERRFSARAGEVGVRDAFLEYFSDDVITFSDRIYVGKDQLKSQPAPTLPPRMILEWEPQLGSVSCSQDLAWLTGPYRVMDRTGERPSRYGLYFSVWKKQATGEWKVVLDLGVSTPFAVPKSDFQPAEKSSGTHLERSADEGLSLLAEAEGDLQLLARRKSESEAICRHAAEGLRVHRPGEMPALGKRAACRLLQPAPIDFRSQGRVVSAAQDLAYTWGEYEAHLGGVAKAGFYARVWQRSGRGWKIILDVAAPRM